jgi:sporulation protein YlmC with PRC-barrel domain
MNSTSAMKFLIAAFSGFALFGGAVAQQGAQQGGAQQGTQQGGAQQGAQPGAQQGGQSGAQQGSGKSGTGSSSTGATAPDAPVVGRIPLGVTVQETLLIAKGYRGSKLLHADVYNDKNQKIGKVEDLIVSPDGKLSTAIIEVGGFLGLKRHRVAIPVDQLKFEDQKKVMLPGATKEALKALPEFEYA